MVSGNYKKNSNVGILFYHLFFYLIKSTKWRRIFLTLETAKEVNQNIKHYLKLEDYEMATRVAKHYKTLEGFNADKALIEIEQAKKKAKK